MSNTDNEQQITPAQSGLMQRLGSVPVGNRGIQLSTIEDVFRFAKAVALSQLCPPGFSETDCFLIIQNGLEVGMSPMAALANTYIVNRRATIFGDMPLALVRQSGLLDDYKQEYQGNPFENDFKCVVSSKRKGSSEPIVTEYSVNDAKLAEIWGKKGPWTNAPKRMLLYRARGFNLRDNFGDVLKGCAIAELDDGENLPGFDNAKTASAKIVEPNFDQTPVVRSPEVAAPATGGEIGPLPPKKPRGRPPKVSPVEAPEPKPEPEPATKNEVAESKAETSPANTPVTQQKAFPEQEPQSIDSPLADIRHRLKAARIPEDSFLQLLLDYGLIECEPGDITMGEITLEKVESKSLELALKNWSQVIKEMTEAAK